MRIYGIPDRFFIRNNPYPERILKKMIEGSAGFVKKTTTWRICPKKEIPPLNLVEFLILFESSCRGMAVLPDRYKRRPLHLARAKLLSFRLGEMAQRTALNSSSISLEGASVTRLATTMATLATIKAGSSS